MRARGRALTLGGVALVLAGCGSDGAALSIDVRTDFAPGLEFSSLRVDVSGPALHTIMRSTRADDDFIAGVRVAELSAQPTGEYLVLVSLLDTRSAEVAESRVRLTLAGDTAISVVITRNCRGVVCPRAGDPAGATTCVGNRCVDPSCVGSRSCTECARDTDCLAGTGCLRAVCADGVCLQAADDASCAAGMRCDPGTMACVARPPDAGSLDAGTFDAGARDAGARDAGRGDAGRADAGPECAAGEPCDDESHCTGPDTCDAFGNCTLHEPVDCGMTGRCDEATRACVPCGEVDQICCAGSVCRVGTCFAGTCFPP